MSFLPWAKPSIVLSFGAQEMINMWYIHVYMHRLVVWSLYIRLLPKVSDKRIQNLSLNCQSFLCFCFSLSQSFNEYSVPGDFSQKHFWYLLSSKMPTIHIFLIWIVVYLATLSNIFNSCSFFFLLRIENNPIFCKNAKS